MSGTEVLDGAIERVTFRNADSGYSVLRLRVAGKRDSVTAVGKLGPVSAGESAVFTGQWIQHPDFGPQFQFESYRLRRPATAEAIEKYFASGVITGVGPAMARRLVAKFGAETLLVVEHQPERLREIPGIGEKRIESIRAGIQQHRTVQEIALFLQGAGVSPAFADRLYRHFGDQTVEAISGDPYALIHHVRGIGFRTADQIAHSLEVPRNSPARLAAGLVYTLSQAVEEGHVFLPLPQVYTRASRLLETPAAALHLLVPQLCEEVRLVAEPDPDGGPDRIFLPPLRHAELGAASGVARLMTAPGKKLLPAAKVLEWLDRRRGPDEVHLSEQQKEALTLVMTERISVITGGPGTGKSTITRALVRAFETAGRSVLLASPTGRAARRLTDVTGRPAATIHKTLEFDPSSQSFRRDQDWPLPADLVVVDEASMLDVILTNSLLKAVRPGAHVVFIGDIDQLPSVGPGNVLRDLIESGSVPVCRLAHVFRQALDSLTVRTAHRVNAGQMPDLPHPSRRGSADCVFLEEPDPGRAVTLLSQLLRVSLPRLGFNASDVQVIAPMNKGQLGVLELNQAIQGVLNPASPEIAEVSRAGATFREGDRVIQLVNDYDRDVFNGDVGQVSAISPGDNTLQVVFPTLNLEESPARVGARGSISSSSDPPGQLAAERRSPYRIRKISPTARPAITTAAAATAGSTRPVEYRFSDLDELQLAYAMTVHKAQGSEFPVVILLVHDTHGPMLQRNLVYTGLTRGRRLTVLLGTRTALGQAVSRQTERSRFTSLAERLRAVLPPATVRD